MPYKLVAILALLVGFIATPAEAKKRHHNPLYSAISAQACDYNNDGRVICGQVQINRPAAIPMGRKNIAPTNGYAMAEQLLPHPSGCPRSLFCGCGARKDLGIDDVRLNLASNWPHYYHGSTRVAVWAHHVAIIEQDLGNGMALLRDYNSGGHQSRRHVRSISGARIVGGNGMASL